MMCCCEECKFVFESVRMLAQCPDCGHGPVRKATDEEIAEYAANRREYGPMRIYGVNLISAAQEAEFPMLISVCNGRPVFQARRLAAPAFLM